MVNKQPSPEADAALATSNDSELCSLVTGDVPAIRECLAWIGTLDIALKDVARALLPARPDSASKLGAPARAVVMDRLKFDAAYMGAQLVNTKYESVVSKTVSAWVSPLLKEAAGACLELIDAIEGGNVPADVILSFMARVKSPSVELRILAQHLQAALNERGALAVAALGLTYEDIKILRVLERNHPRLLTATKIAGLAVVDEKTTRLRLKNLLDKEMAEKPETRNKGAVITAKGLDMLKKMPPES